MKINVKALFEHGGIRCTLKGDDGTARPARVAYVTETTVSAARAAAAGNEALKPGDGDPDVTYGSIVTVAQTASGGTAGRVLAPGEQAPFEIAAGAGSLGMTGPDMLALREALVARRKAGDTLTRDQSRALGGVQEIFRMVASAPDTDRFPAELIAQAYHASMIDAFGEFELPVDTDSFTRKSRADLLRARIGLLEPGHADALASAAPLREILSGAGIEVSESGIGAEIRNPSMAQVTEEAIRRTVQADDRLCTELFGAMTATPVERFSAAMIPLSGLEALRAQKPGHRLSGEWIDRISTRARALTESGKPGTRFDSAFFAERGRDILVISDKSGQENDVALVYSWPTADRIPVMEIEDGRVLNVSPEEVPSETEISRLSETLGQIEAMTIHDPDFEIERERLDG